MTSFELGKMLMMAADVQSFGAPDFKKEHVLNFWFDALKDVPAQTIAGALKSLLKEPKFPSLGQVLSACGIETEKPVSDNELVQDAVSRIETAVRRHGTPWPDAARKDVGEFGWEIVTRAGGWSAVCAPDSETQFAFLLKELKQTGLSILKAKNLGIDRPLMPSDTKPQLGSKADETIKRLIAATKKD